jgi:hypothetical protein
MTCEIAMIAGLIGGAVMLAWFVSTLVWYLVTFGF